MVDAELHNITVSVCFDINFLLMETQALVIPVEKNTGFAVTCGLFQGDLMEKQALLAIYTTPVRSSLSNVQSPPT